MAREIIGKPQTDEERWVDRAFRSIKDETIIREYLLDYIEPGQLEVRHVDVLFDNHTENPPAPENDTRPLIINITGA